MSLDLEIQDIEHVLPIADIDITDHVLDSNVSNASIESTAATTERFIERLYYIQQSIQKLGTGDHVNVLRIVSGHSTDSVNENSNGSFINLSILPRPCIDEIHKYLKFVSEKERDISVMEARVETIENRFFSPE